MKILVQPLSGYPMPAKRRCLKLQHILDTLTSMPVSKGRPSDESFVTDTNGIYMLAKTHGIKIRTAKESGVGIRVWRVK